MLISFTVSNYRSIKDKLTLSFLSVKSYKELEDSIIEVVNKANILKSLVIYGANASGKSNLLKALTGFIDFINSSSSNKLNDKIELYDPFLLDRHSTEKPSEFEIEFFLKETRYTYSVTINHNNISEEGLWYYPKKQKVRVFERNNDVFDYGKVLKGEKKSIEARLLKNQLFLSKAANENQEFLVDIYNYFSSIDDKYTMLSGYFDKVAPATLLGSALKEEGDEFLKNLENIVTALDTGIDSLIIKPAKTKNFMGIFPEEANRFFSLDSELLKDIPNLNFELFTRHKISNSEDANPAFIDFELNRESSGTRNMIILSMFLLDTFKKGSIMMVDELEKSLHPQIVRKLIELFHDAEINVNNAQLLFTTHDTSLLDNKLFRRDQIWFTEKDEYGATELFSLSSYDGIRKDTPFDKWYMSGRFGATPVVNESKLKYGNATQKRK
ncbi:MAG: ATP-binding protein [Bacteroidales bacterium]|nr:ATP-binding protein [Bacteroidales bacterium]